MKQLVELFKKKRQGDAKYRIRGNARKLLLEGLERRQLMAVDLNPGDLAVVAYNTGGSPDSFAVVFLREIDGGTQFFVNDNEIANASSTAFTELNEGEASFTVKAGQTIPAGTVLVLPWGAAAVSTTTYDWTSTSGFGLGNNNEELFFYEATAINSTTFSQLLYFVGIGTSTVPVHNSLTLGTTAIEPTGSASRYKTSGAVYTGTPSVLLAAIGDTTANWEGRATTDTINATDWAFSVLTGSFPEMNVLGNSNSILDNDTTPSSLDGTDFGSLVAGSTPITQTFTIENTGAATLNLTGTPIVSISGGSNFSITTQPVGNSVDAAGSTTFVVTFNPTAIGTQTATISIANDDSDENPYNFDITGIVSAAATPEINLQGNGTNIADGDNTPSTSDDTNYGSRVVGTTPVSRTFTIQNLGTGPLDLTGTPNVTISGSTDFTVTTQPLVDPVPAGNSTTFVVTFTPTTPGIQTATISIANDDSDESPYNFDVAGEVLFAFAEANVQGNGVSIVDGDATPELADHTAFANAPLGGTSTRTFTIQNTGTIDLTLSDFTSSNTLFTIPSPPTGPVAPGGSATFTVVFTPSTTFTETSTISFLNNDGDENPYNFVVSATGIVVADVRLNEIFVNPNGSDDNREYVEIRATSGGSASLAGLTLLVIESDTGAGNGTIDGILPLDSFSTGTNGLLQLGNNHSTSNPWPVVSGTSVGDLNLAGSASGTNFLNSGGMENGGITFLIVAGFTGVAAGTDLSSTNDGVFTSTPWSSIVDSVGWGSEVTFSTAVVTQSTGTPDAVSRIVGDNAASSTTAWFAGDIEATPALAQGYLATFASANLPAGAGITPGGSNYSQSISVTPSSISIPEGASNTFDVSLSTAPFTEVTVSIAGTGDADLTSVQSSLMFAVGSTVAQTVTINAAEDADTTNGTTTFDVSATNVALKTVTATEADNDSALATPTITLTSGNVVFNNSVYVATASVTGFNSPDPSPSLTFTFYSDAGGTTVISAPENVGTYFVQGFTTSNAGNNAAQSAITQFEITPFALTATATAANKVYDGNIGAVVSISLTGVFSGDTVSGSASGTFDNKNVGTGKTVTVGSVTLAGADAANYTVGSAGNTTANITAAPLTVTADAKSKTLGQADPALTFTTSAFVGGETAATALTGSLTRVAGEAVGTYAINQGNLEAVNGNYAITYVGALFTINPALAAPTLTSVIVNGADSFLNSAQRSMVTSVVVTFSTPVVLSAGAFSITNIGLFTAGNANLAQGQILVTANFTKDVYTIRFGVGANVNTRQGTGALGNSLADGNYRLTIDTTKVSNAGGNLTGNNLFGAVAADNFFRMYGDANGDGAVNAFDRSALLSALNTATNAALDFDGNGTTSAGVDTTNYFANNGKRRRLF